MARAFDPGNADLVSNRYLQYVLTELILFYQVERFQTQAFIALEHGLAAKAAGGPWQWACGHSRTQ